METLSEFLNANKKAKGFVPEPYYSPEGDSLTFYFKDEQSYRERIDDFLTVYRSMRDNGLIGCQIKGLPKAFEIMGNFGITIKDKAVALSMLFMGLATEVPESKQFYLELGKVAKDAEIPTKEVGQILQPA